MEQLQGDLVAGSEAGRDPAALAETVPRGRSEGQGQRRHAWERELSRQAQALLTEGEEDERLALHLDGAVPSGGLLVRLVIGECEIPQTILGLLQLDRRLTDHRVILRLERFFLPAAAATSRPLLPPAAQQEPGNRHHARGAGPVRGAAAESQGTRESQGSEAGTKAQDGTPEPRCGSAVRTHEAVIKGIGDEIAGQCHRVQLVVRRILAPRSAEPLREGADAKDVRPRGLVREHPGRLMDQGQGTRSSEAAAQGFERSFKLLPEDRFDLWKPELATCVPLRPSTRSTNSSSR